MKIKDFIPVNKPRNFVAKNAMKTTSGAGAHRDKKKEQKQGYEKHKGKDVSEDKKKGLDGKACWKGYRYAGTKMKGGKRVDNCVKVGESITEDTIRPKLAAALKELGFKGPFKLGQLPKWMAELQDGRFDKETSIMIGGNDPEYDPWVAKGYDYGYAYGMESGYQTGLSAQEVYKQAKGDMMSEGRKNYGYDDAGFSLAPGHDEGEPVYNPRYDRTGQYDRKSKYSQNYNYNTGKPLDSEPKKTGYVFYNVADPQTAQKLGLRQTKSGKWYLPADDTFRQQTADKVFGKGRYWEPK